MQNDLVASGGAAVPSSIESEAVYGEHYYDSLGGPAYVYEGHWKDFFGSVADHLIRQFRPTSVLDAGCAKGFLVQALRERGVEAYGFDVSDYAIDAAADEIKPYLWVGSITEPLDRRYDLIVCIEVLEHLESAAQIDRGIEVLTAATDRILFSSTNEGANMAEPSHFNMKAPEEWGARFAAHGFLRDLLADVDWLTPWSMLVERRPGITPADVVLEYDRVFARQVREIYELRLAAVRLEARLQEAVSSGTNPQVEQQRAAERALLEQREQQATDALVDNLRLRDLLRVAERELGHATGQVASLHDQLLGYQGIADRYHDVVHSTTWRLAWKALSPYRKLRGRM